MEQKSGYGNNHRIQLDNRRDGIFTGITDVISFDADEIVFESLCGGIVLKGSELHIKNLNLENKEVSIDGNIDSFTYVKSKAGNKEPFLKKIFK
ncbi:MAG: sporulation protein YabP [Lachnospiraceae bacterium]|nr:sporulation protein YabP [Lachnospiraceae bacterium]